MDPAAPKYPPKVVPNSGSALDISAPIMSNTPVEPTTSSQSIPQNSDSSIASSGSSPSSTAPSSSRSVVRPVMSAKAAINAMYASDKSSANAKLIPSAREAVNSAGRLASKNFKSASNLHHGSLQKIQKIPSTPKSLESTRTSASAILKTTNPNSKDIPVVRTSLKLGGNNMQPKDGPVVLPAGARMANAARPVGNLSDSSNDSAITIKRTISGSRHDPQIITSGRPQLPATARSRRVIRDPQMLSGGRRTLPAKGVNKLNIMDGTSSSIPITAPSATPVSLPRASTQIPTSLSNDPSINMVSRPSGMSSATRKLVRPRRFRTAPKNYAEAQPAINPVDSSYAITEPPKLAVRRRNDVAEDLGVVKNFRPTKLPQPIGDTAPIGRLAEQRVASGHGGPARPESSIKTENTSNYSFSRRTDKTAKATSYASADKSPFLKSVNVEKRPLSDSSVPTPISLPHSVEPKPEKNSRKNTYQKKTSAKADLPVRPTVIVPSSRRSKAPLFFLIILTIILGAAVGAAVYLCFFQ